MKIKLYLWIISTFMECIFMLYHEMWHWLVGMLFYCMRRCDKPFLRIDTLPRIERSEIEGYTTYSASMSVWYSYNDGKMKKWMRKCVTIAPAFGMLFLILISPIYMIPLYISHHGPLWLSMRDIEKL